MPGEGGGLSPGGIVDDRKLDFETFEYAGGGLLYQHDVTSIDDAVVIIRRIVKHVAGLTGTALPSARGAVKSLGASMGGTALDPQRVTPIKERGYLHFDLPLADDVRGTFSISPSDVLTHSFWPLLGFDRSERRIDFDHDPHWKISKKKRPIRYASHYDSAIYAHYCQELSSRYELELLQRDISRSVLAYRSGVGSNISFAKSLFDEIRERGDCRVICLDVSKFFDNLDHNLLDKRVKQVLGVQKLSLDWIKVFKSLTKYSYVDKGRLTNAIQISGEQGKVCSLHQYKSKIRSLIEVNHNPFGIPQGSPLSGALANVYMLPIDTLLTRHLELIGGSYRRYSDDIAIVLPSGINADAILMAINIMLDASFLKVNPKKTTRSTFRLDASGILKSEGDLLQYLGFTFDGQRILIRSESLKRFYARMKASIRIAVRAAKEAGYSKDEIRRRSLVGRYTHWGDSRNFVQYAYRASKVLDSPQIRRQLRNHVRIFSAHFAKMKARYYP